MTSVRQHRVVVTLLMAASLVGCGDDLEPETFEPPLRCSYELEDLWDVVGCRTGLQMAGRYSDSVLVDTREWMRYYRVMRLVQQAEPLTVMGHPGSSFAAPIMRIGTRRQDVADKWRAGILETGIPEVDRAFGNNVQSIKFLGELGPLGPGWTFEFTFGAKQWASLSVIEDLLEPVADQFYDYEVVVDPKNTTVEWDGEIANVHVMAGWSDCIVACVYWHYWYAQVHPSGFVRVTDLGGDPIPEELAAIQRQYVEDAQ